MSALYATALNTFKEMGWHYREVAEHSVIESDFEAHHTKVPLHMQVFGETHIVTVVPPPRCRCRRRTAWPCAS